MSVAELVLLVPIGLLVGIFSAMFGVGGGILVVPVLVIAFGFDQHLAQGTSLAVIVPTAAVGAWSHFRRGFVDLRTVGRLAAGGVVGVVAGGAVALATDGDILRALFGAVLVVTGARLVWRARRDT